MRRPTQEQLKKKNDIIAIAIIKVLLEKDKLSEAIDVAEKRKFTPEQFGKMAHMVDLSAEKIYKTVIAK